MQGEHLNVHFKTNRYNNANAGGYDKADGYVAFENVDKNITAPNIQIWSITIFFPIE